MRIVHFTSYCFLLSLDSQLSIPNTSPAQYASTPFSPSILTKAQLIFIALPVIRVLEHSAGGFGELNRHVRQVFMARKPRLFLQSRLFHPVPYQRASPTACGNGAKGSAGKKKEIGTTNDENVKKTGKNKTYYLCCRAPNLCRWRRPFVNVSVFPVCFAVVVVFSGGFSQVEASKKGKR